ncbi:MAG: hypothetical protein AcusKO_38380 [Acuticoccus sp.]
MDVTGGGARGKVRHLLRVERAQRDEERAGAAGCIVNDMSELRAVEHRRQHSRCAPHVGARNGRATRLAQQRLTLRRGVEPADVDAGGDEAPRQRHADEAESEDADLHHLSAPP